jgi:Helix-turn-helix domain
MVTGSHSEGGYGGGTTAPLLEPLRSIPATQELLGHVSRHTVLRLLDSGELVRIRVGARTLVDPQSIRDYIARQRENAP